MDAFSRTFLPAAAEAGLALPAVSRHLPVLRRCIQPDDATVLVAHCTRQTAHGELLLVLTYRRLVVTQESRMVHRLRLHLNTELRHLTNVTWNPDSRACGVELAATAVDGIRERFWIKVGYPKQVWHLDALFTQLFRPRLTRRVGMAAPVRRAEAPARKVEKAAEVSRKASLVPHAAGTPVGTP